MLSHHPNYKHKDKCSCGAEDALFDFITVEEVLAQMPLYGV